MTTTTSEPGRTLRKSAAFVLLLAGCLPRSARESFAIPEPVERVVVRVDTGEVLVTGSVGATGATVDVELDCRTVVPDYEVRADGGTLRVALAAGTDASACTGRFEIVVPRQASLDLRTGVGDVRVANLRGSVSVVTYDGSVSLTDVAGTLDVVVPDGDVAGDGIESAEATVTVGAGDVRLVHGAAPVQVDLAVILGDVEVLVPAGAYDVDAETTSGLVQVSGVDERREAPNAIRLGAERGNITLTGYEAGGPERPALRSLRSTSQTDTSSANVANRRLSAGPASVQPKSSST
jgi:hypothetical protein